MFDSRALFAKMLDIMNQPVRSIEEQIVLLLKKVKEIDAIDETKVEKAIQFGMDAHHGQMRKSGEKYYVHPLRVAIKATEYALDTKTIIGALLHDIIEDTDKTYEDIACTFGETVANLVYALTKVKEDKKLSFRRILKLAHKDFRVILIKLLDRLDNLTDLMWLPRVKQVRICDESVLIYSEIAHGLGLIKIEDGLRNLSLRLRYPRTFQKIESNLKQLFQERKEKIQTYLKLLKQVLPFNLYSSISPHYFTPHHYITKRGDVLHILESITIITIEPHICYELLGYLHTHFRCIPLSIRDYISNPKSNGWRGLETKLLIKGEAIPIYIVTEEYHEKNRMGVITLIKEGVYQASEYQEFLKIYRDLSNETVRIEDVLKYKKTRDIQVFTPKGKVLELRYGSTILDFAFMVHTDLGVHCSGGVIENLRYPPHKILQDGMIVEVKVNKKVVRVNLF